MLPPSARHLYSNVSIKKERTEGRNVLDQEFSGIALLWKGKMTMGVSKTGTSSVSQPEHITLTTQK
jgi:hypothetical protein